MAEFFVYFAVKLQSIIGYDRLRYSEPADNILPHKLGDDLSLMEVKASASIHLLK